MKKENVFIFGASAAGINKFDHITEAYNVLGFIDNDEKKWGKTINEKIIYSPEVLKEYKENIKIFICSMYYKEIADQLHRLGKNNYSSFFYEKEPDADIKLVIWDLDDTFWQGTLSEGEVKKSDENINIVKKLTDRGIINSVVSKNDFDKAAHMLKEFDVWDYFIFPKIQWESKGKLVRGVIQAIKLRPENVLFIDDNVMNLEEVKFYNEKINYVTPKYLNKILDSQWLKGKDDKEHSRLKQYKLLEKKQEDEESFDDNIAFLLSSNIKVYLENCVEEHLHRVYELIQRTNQLNYTKIRIIFQQLEALFKDSEYLNYSVFVEDKYGKHGLVGYICLNQHTKKLLHFLFSCRILNMGVEQYCYFKLGFPEIAVIPPVASELNDYDIPYWINKEHDNDNNVDEEKNKLRLLMKGGCDLSQVIHYLSPDFQVIPEFNYTNNSNNVIHREHTIYLRDSVYLSEQQKKSIGAKIPFVEEDTYSTQIFSEAYEVLIYSLLMDYTQEVYVNKSDRIRVCYGGYENILVMEEEVFEQNNRAKKIYDMNREFLQYFKKNYDHEGQISEEEFLNNLKFLREKIRLPIIFINGAETLPENEKATAALRRHIKMNKALDRFISENKDCYLVDIRKIVKEPEDLTDSIRHYKRIIYAKIAKEIKNTINGFMEEKNID